MPRLDDDRLKDEVIHYVLMTMMQHKEASDKLKESLVRGTIPSSYLLRDAVALSVRLKMVSDHFPTGKVQLGKMKPRDMRRLIVVILEEATRRLMIQARGAVNSGDMNSTDSMVRVVARIEMSEHARFVEEWTGKI